MDDTLRLQLANRMHIALLREIGQGIDLDRMLQSDLYARDVLLVCKAFAGTELQQLGSEFVQASRTSAPMPDAAAADSDFAPSSPAGEGGRRRKPAPPPPLSSRWMYPSRWFID